MKKTSKKRPQGRPAGIRFGRQIAIKLTESQEAAWTEAANAQNMTMSVWVRYVVDQHLASGGK